MVSYIAPQVERPERTLPRAIVAGVGGVILVYLLANLAYLHAVGIDGIAGDVDFATRVASAAFGSAGERLLAAGMAVSALGFTVVTIVTTPWMYVAMAGEGLFFRRIAALSPRTGVPSLALLLQAAVALVYLFATTLSYLVDAVVFVEWLFHGLVALGLILLRRARPELPRPFRSPFFPLAPAIYLGAAGLVVVGTFWTSEPLLWLVGSGIVLAGCLFYWPWRRLVRRVS